MQETKFMTLDEIIQAANQRIEDLYEQDLKTVTVSEFIALTISQDNKNRLDAQLADGTIFSIQASEFHHCHPKEDGLKQYDSFEVAVYDEKRKAYGSYDYSGVISIPELAKYDSDGSFGYVPIDLLESVVEKHGGILHPFLEQDLAKDNISHYSEAR